MKYEMIFGDKDLADKFTNERSVFIVDRDGVYFEFEDGSEAGIKYIANFCAIGDRYYMRRIIVEPNRWTVEDQKAGKLPEVGCRAIWHDDNGMKYTVKIETAFFGNECAVSIDDEAIYFAEKFCLFPIETPAEKAARLKSEWCAKAAKQLKNLEYTSTLTSIYDALLSGELQAPEVK